MRVASAPILPLPLEPDFTLMTRHAAADAQKDGKMLKSSPTSLVTSLPRFCAAATSRFRAGQVRSVSHIRRPSLLLMPSSITSVLFVWVLLVVAGILIPAASAVQIPFENCLPDSYRLGSGSLKDKPIPLQWQPIRVDAVFDTENPSHNLQVIVWGNVTGSYSTNPLPPANSSHWSNDGEPEGKIIRQPESGPGARATTLKSKVNVLTYEPWNSLLDFCESSLVNASCPLSPIFNSTGLEMPYGLPSFNLSKPFNSSYAFASFSSTFLIIYGDSRSTNIGCVSATITPQLGDLSWLLRYLPLVILIFVGFATTFAGVFSPWGTTDVFHWTSNYGRDADLLRLVTPGFGDCLQYIQFAALTSGLTLNYPGFYQPIVSQVGWSALMFNESFVSKSSAWQSIQDGIYVTNGTYGLQKYAQLIGMADVEDIWAGMMVWLLVIIAAIFVLIQAGFFFRWIYRFISKIPEEDLRAKNIPFTVGNVVRIVFNYFLLPIVALSTFQLVVASQSAEFAVALAVLTLVILIGFAGWLLYLIITTRPRAVLFDDLPTVLLYGPLYNTYSDEAAAFALIPVLLTFVRGIAIGAVQPFGIAQLVLLAICEVIQILTLHAFRPFHSPTSMNAYHTLFSALRFTTTLLMIAFVPQLGVTEGPKGWIGYTILVLHAIVLILGFFLGALQTVVEVAARLLGAGGDDIRGQTRGGLSKIFGMRQLQRRISRRETGPSRQSQLSSTAMLDADETAKSGYAMPGGRLRSESAGSGFLLGNRKRNSSALDSIDAFSAPHRNFDSGASSFTPTTPGEASTFSFLPSPGAATRPQPAVTIESTDPYYRPPRRRQDTLTGSGASERQRGSIADSRRYSQVGAALGDPNADQDATMERDVALAPQPYSAISLAPRADYSTREVDFYYGVRGPALNSDGPGRKLGTGPADPTGPMASAAGWFRNMLGGKSKEKGKGFEVVRSARMPEAMRARGGDFGDEIPPEGIPVAMGVLRNGPIESDDDEPKGGRDAEEELLDVNRDSQDSESEDVDRTRISDIPPVLPGIDRGGSFKLPSRIPSKASRHQMQPMPIAPEFDIPSIPRKSSRRHSGAGLDHSPNPSFNLVLPGSASTTSHGGFEASAVQPASFTSSTLHSRLPFERSNSQKRLSSTSSLDPTDDFDRVDLRGPSNGERPTSYGFVPHHSISRVDPGHQRHVDLLGSSAELVDERGDSTGSPVAGGRH